jgi:choline kinase
VIGVLLAAGRGRRLGRRLGRDRPKALIEVGGRTLLARHLENLAALGASCRVVTGFEAQRLEAHLPPGVERIHNPAYRRGSALSFACALADLDEDAVVMDADVLYDPTILRDVAALACGFALDPRTDPGAEEMMIGVRAGRVRAIRRGRLEGFDLVGEGVGFFKAARADLAALRACAAAADPDGDYEAALDAFVAERGADYVEVAGRPWTEIDFPEDLERAAREVLPRLPAGLRNPKDA